MKIVIVEDDEGIGFSLRLALEDRGHDVEVYADPTKVPYRAICADVILVDYFMPKMDGEQVILKLKEDPSLQQTRILLMSAAPSLQELAKRLQVDALAKPFDLDHLFSCIEVV